MSPEQAIYREVYSQCMSSGCGEMLSRSAGEKAVNHFKKRTYLKSTSQLIKDTVANAKKFKKRASTR